MKQWRWIMKKFKISEFARLAGVTVRTLQYYDSFGLLKPSDRLPNGYRLYGRKDLQKLLQVLSLKFLNIDLTTIKELLDGRILIQEELVAQQKQIDDKINKLIEARKVMKKVYKVSRSIHLDALLKLIEMYRAVYHLNQMRIRKLLPKSVLEKSTELEERFLRIENELDTLTHDALSEVCTEFLQEAYQNFPDIMRNQPESV